MSEPGFLRSDVTEARQVLPALATRLTLREATLTLRDAALIRRMHAIPASGVPDDQDGGKAAELPPDLVAQLRQSMSGADEAAAERSLQAWVGAGGELTVSASPAAPVPLFRTGGYGGELVSASSDPDFLGSLNLKVGS